MKRRNCMMFVAALCVTLLSCTGKSVVEAEEAVDYTQGEAVTITMAHYYPEDNPHHEAFLAIKDYLEEKTDGRITCEIYSNGSFGDQMNTVQAVTMGTLDVFNHTFDSSYYEPAGVVQGPYLFRSYDHWHNFIGSEVYNEIVTGLEESMGVKIPATFHFGFREVLCTDKCETPEDFDGLSMRVVNIAPYPEAATVLGATGVPIGIDDVYMGLKTGVVKATENPMAQLQERSFDEVTNYLIKTDHMLALETFIMSEKCWNNLSETDQKLVEEAFWMGASIIEEGYEAADAKVEADFVEEGIEVVEPDKELFMERLPLVFENYPEWEEYYEKIQAIEG